MFERHMGTYSCTWIHRILQRFERIQNGGRGRSSWTVRETERWKIEEGEKLTEREVEGERRGSLVAGG
jgi:hypothetical protein